MDDLSGLSNKLSVERVTWTALRFAAPTTVPGETLAIGFVRLLDHALIEYELARTRLEEAQATRHLSARLRTQAHLETCIWAMHRALSFLERLHTCGFYLGDGTPLVPRSRGLEVIRRDARDRIRNLRDAVEHVEKDVISGQTDPRGPITLKLEQTGVSLGGAEVTFVELARWLRQMYEVAERLNTCGPVESAK